MTKETAFGAERLLREPGTKYLLTIDLAPSPRVATTAVGMHIHTIRRECLDCVPVVHAGGLRRVPAQSAGVSRARAHAPGARQEHVRPRTARARRTIPLGPRRWGSEGAS